MEGSDVLGLSLVKDDLRANRGTLGGKLFESDLFVSSAEFLLVWFPFALVY